jgi:hypothetical protein
MIEFDYREIRISATSEMNRYDYKDFNNIGRTRFDRNVSVMVSFWNFVIYDDLYELALLKSSMSYFMQAYWKRRTKEGSKIELDTSLEHQFSKQTLSLIARQKNNQHSLEVSLVENGFQSKCMRLNGQEVIMLDIAISKVIAVLTPQTTIN